MAIAVVVSINKNDNNSVDNGTVHYYGNTIILFGNDELENT